MAETDIEKLKKLKAKATPAWEAYSDPAYYDCWAVRRVGETSFNNTFHLVSGDEARVLVAFLNEHAPSLASKDAEIERLKAERDEESRWVSRHLADDAKTRAMIGDEFCLVPPDGGDVKTWEAAAAMRARLTTALAALGETREALEPFACSDGCRCDQLQLPVDQRSGCPHRKARATLAKLNALEGNEDENLV